MAEEKTQQTEQARHAAQSAASAAAMKKRRKKWYPILAPKMFNNVVLGESLLDESAQLMGKPLSMSVMNILGDPKKQNMTIYFTVSKVQEGKGMAEVIMFELQPHSLRRLMRRERKKVDDSFICRTSDNKYVTVKPLIIMSGNASHAVMTDLRKHTRQLMKEILHQNSFEIIIQDLLEYKVQKYLKDMLTKIYPVRNVEIRMFGLSKANRETVDDILLKVVPKEAEEEEPAEEEEAPEENAEQPLDQMQEIEEEHKAKRKKASEDENPLSEGV